MKSRFFLALAFCLLSVFAQAQNVFKDYINYTFNGEYLKINTKSGVIVITPYYQKTIRVTYLIPMKDRKDSSYVLVGKPKPGPVKVKEAGGEIVLSTRAIQLSVNKKTLQIDFKIKGKELLSRNLSYFTQKDNNRILTFQLNDTEALYGTGSRAIPLNRRGYLLENYHQPHYGYSYGEQNLNISVPLIVSSHGYALYFDHSEAGSFDLGKTNKNILQYSIDSPQRDFSRRASYFFIAGTNDEILNDYTSLTGRQPLPPRWALGFIQSRFGYKSAQETIETVKKTIAAGYPLDATVLDLFWYGDVKTMGNHDWRLDSFPQPEKMLAELKSMGVKTIPITQTFVTKLSDNFNTASQANLFAKDYKGKDFIIADFWAGPTALIDIFKPQSQQYLWNFYRKRINEGVAGWWCDLGEPEKHPDSIVHVKNVPARSVHNAYPLIWAKTIFDGYRKDFPEQRVFNLARSGGAGMQRYSTFPWSGDVSRSWNGFKAQIPIMLGMSMSGIGYMHSDAGGFAQGEKDPELYIRWMQYAAFTPIYRAHADPNPAPPEPVFWDENTQKIVKEYIKLRYRFLPYNYSLAFENSRSGRPLAMPVNYREPNNVSLKSVDDEYLWGDDLLIAPIYEKGKTERKVVFPEGKWLDYLSGKVYTDSALITADLSALPIFARSGSFIPMTKDMQNTDNYTSDTLLVKYFPDAETQARFTLYHDDGKDPRALQNDYEALIFTDNYQKIPNTINIMSSKPGKKREIYFEIFNVKKPFRIYFNDNNLILLGTEHQLNKYTNTACYDPLTQILKIHITNSGEEQVLNFE